MSKMRSFAICLIASACMSSTDAARAQQSGCLSASAFARHSFTEHVSDNQYRLKGLVLDAHLSLIFVEGDVLHTAQVCNRGSCAELPFLQVFVAEPDQVIEEDYKWFYFQIYLISESKNYALMFKERRLDRVVAELDWEEYPINCK